MDMGLIPPSIYDIIDTEELSVEILPDDSEIKSNGTVVYEMRVYYKSFNNEEFNLLEFIKEKLTKATKVYCEKHKKKILYFKPDVKICIDANGNKDFYDMQFFLYYVE